MRWLPLLLGIVLILAGFLHQKRSQSVIDSFMRTRNEAAYMSGGIDYHSLPLSQKIELEETRVLEMETLDDPGPLNSFQSARRDRAEARIAIWAGLALTLLALLLVHGTRASPGSQGLDD